MKRGTFLQREVRAPCYISELLPEATYLSSWVCGGCGHVEQTTICSSALVNVQSHQGHIDLCDKAWRHHSHTHWLCIPPRVTTKQDSWGLPIQHEFDWGCINLLKTWVSAYVISPGWAPGCLGFVANQFKVSSSTLGGHQSRQGQQWVRCPL